MFLESPHKTPFVDDVPLGQKMMKDLFPLHPLGPCHFPQEWTHEFHLDLNASILDLKRLLSLPSIPLDFSSSYLEGA